MKKLLLLVFISLSCSGCMFQELMDRYGLCWVICEAPIEARCKAITWDEPGCEK